HRRHRRVSAIRVFPGERVGCGGRLPYGARLSGTLPRRGGGACAARAGAGRWSLRCGQHFGDARLSWERPPGGGGDRAWRWPARRRGCGCCGVRGGRLVDVGRVGLSAEREPRGGYTRDCDGRCPKYPAPTPAASGCWWSKGFGFVLSCPRRVLPELLKTPPA